MVSASAASESMSRMVLAGTRPPRTGWAGRAGRADSLLDRSPRGYNGGLSGAVRRGRSRRVEMGRGATLPAFPFGSAPPVGPYGPSPVSGTFPIGRSVLAHAPIRTDAGPASRRGGRQGPSGHRPHHPRDRGRRRPDRESRPVGPP